MICNAKTLLFLFVDGFSAFDTNTKNNSMICLILNSRHKMLARLCKSILFSGHIIINVVDIVFDNHLCVCAGECEHTNWVMYVVHLSDYLWCDGSIFTKLSTSPSSYCCHLCRGVKDNNINITNLSSPTCSLLNIARSHEMRVEPRQRYRATTTKKEEKC